MSTISDVTGPMKGPAAMPDQGAVSTTRFQDSLNGYLNDVNQLIQEAGSQVDKMVAGEAKELHEVMIAVEKASVGLELVVEIRNKLLESYRELMRMQV